jgi:hypothetical protein
MAFLGVIDIEIMFYLDFELILEVWFHVLRVHKEAV